MSAIEKLKHIINNFQLIWLLELFIIFAVLFIVYKILFKNNAQKLVWIYFAFTVLTGLFLFFGVANGALCMLLLQGLFIVIILSLFSTEVKRDIWTKRADHKHESNGAKTDTNGCIEEIVKAVQNMSKNDIGAIIILSNNNLPTSILDSGVYLDSTISAQLIESIFFPKTALHDGALVINGSKIQAAGCFLPLAQEVNLSKDLGSRHRAGIGLTETVNVTAIIVSEETGIISIAKGGKIIRYVDTTVLRETLKQYYWQDMID